MAAPGRHSRLRNQAARRTGTRTGTKTDVQPATDEQVELAFPWKVIVWDDPVNLMNYVVWVFQRVFGWSAERATRHMLEVHNEGRSLVATAERERAEFLVTRLHGYGLLATLERNEST